MRGRLTVSSVFLAVGLLVPLSRSRVDAATPPGKIIVINARRFRFDPAEISLREGVPVTLELHSTDTPHGLRVTELGIELKADKGAMARQTITPEKAGDFVGQCSVFCGTGHGVMKITFHIAP